MIKPYLNLKSIGVHVAEIERFLKITKNMQEITRFARSAKPERQSATLPMPAMVMLNSLEKLSFSTKYEVCRPNNF